MSFMSMLNMAKGKEPQVASGSPKAPATKTNIEKNSSDKSARTSASVPSISSKPTHERSRPHSKSQVNDRREAASTSETAHQSRQVSRSKGTQIQQSRPKSITRKSITPVKASPSHTTYKYGTTRGQTPDVSKCSKEETPAIRKKLSFKQMMKQANDIDPSKLEISLKIKSSKDTPPPVSSQRSAPSRLSVPPNSSPTPREVSEKRSDIFPRKAPISRGIRAEPSGATSSRTSKENDIVRVKQSESPSISSRSRESAPVARPSAALAAKLKERGAVKEKAARNRGRKYEDEDLDDFVVDEEDDENEQSASSEIWSMFNRNPPRQYYDSESDSDMEAHGAEILDEERMSAVHARREDQREERKLAELAQKKLQRRR